MSKHIESKITQFALAAFLCSSMSGALSAQEAGFSLEEIIVTARKVEESLQDVPLSITAFGAEDIADKSIDELDDVALLTPGLTFEDYSNGGFGTPIIRGASQFNIDALEQNVSTFVDGVYIPRQYAVDLGTVDMQRIEVVKGPQSALYGANAFMGAINYVTRQASLEEMYADVGVTVGDGGRTDFSGSVSFPLIMDVLAVKLNASSTEFDGDWTNEHPAAGQVQGKGTDDTLGGWDNESYGITIVAQPTDVLNIELAYNNYKTLTESRAQSRLAAGRSDLNCGNPFFFNPANPKVFCGELPETPVVADSTGDYVAQGFIVDPRSYFESDTDILRAAFTADLTDSVTLSYQFANIEGDVFSPGGSDRDPITGTVPFGGTEPANFFTVLPVGGFDYDTHELRFEMTADSGIYAMVGVFLLDGEDLDAGNAGYAAPMWTDSLAVITEADIAAGATNNMIETESTALFGRVTVPLVDDKLQVAVEARYTDESKDGSDPTGEYTYDDTYFTPRVSLDYNLNDNQLLYVSAAKGVKSGGINAAVNREPEPAFLPSFLRPFAPLPDDERFYGPDENTTYEIGTKNTLMDGRLQINATAYLVDWSDLQVSVAADGATTTTATITANLGSAESTGLELDLNYLLSESLTLNAGLAISDASYDSGVISQRVVRAGLCDDIVCNADGDVGGNELPRSSDAQWNIGAQYDSSFASSDLDFFFRVDVAGQSDQYVSEINTATIPSRTLVNLRTGISNDNWSAELWVKNATDEDYVSNAFYIPSAFFVDYVPTWGAQRRVGLTLDYNF